MKRISQYPNYVDDVIFFGSNDTVDIVFGVIFWLQIIDVITFFADGKF